MHQEHSTDYILGGEEGVFRIVICHRKFTTEQIRAGLHPNLPTPLQSRGGYSPRDGEGERCGAWVKRWFHVREGRWLVVLDSADIIDNDRDKSYIDLGYFIPAPQCSHPNSYNPAISRSLTPLNISTITQPPPNLPHCSPHASIFARVALCASTSTITLNSGSFVTAN